jgi:hypothetical protein
VSNRRRPTSSEPDDQGWDFSHDPEFKAYVARARSELVPMIEQSSVGISLVTKSEVDIKFAIELGLMIMLDKPIIAVVLEGAAVPPKLAKVVDAILYDGPDLQRQMAETVQRLAEA